MHHHQMRQFNTKLPSLTYLKNFEIFSKFCKVCVTAESEKVYIFETYFKNIYKFFHVCKHMEKTKIK